MLSARPPTPDRTRLTSCNWALGRISRRGSRKQPWFQDQSTNNFIPRTKTTWRCALVCPDLNTVDIVQLGIGSNIQTRIAEATVVPGSVHQQLYTPDKNNLAVRFGLSYALNENAKTVVRGGFGTFYDRSFDNLWENLALNNVLLQPGFLFQPGVLSTGQFNYSMPLRSELAGAVPGASNFDRLTMYQPGIRTPYVNSLFFGLQRQLGQGMTLETNYTGSFGRELITTDRVNRTDSVNEPDGSMTSLNPALPEILYRGNQGDSDRSEE